MPTAVPMIAASASGLSITRVPPNWRWRSSVPRKPPPSPPTSSPMITPPSSRSISWSRARFSALTMFSLPIGSSSSGPAWGSAAGAPPPPGAADRHPAARGARRAAPPGAPAAPRRRDRRWSGDRLPPSSRSAPRPGRSRRPPAPRGHRPAGSSSRGRRAPGGEGASRPPPFPVHRQEFVAVHLDAGKAVAEGLLGQRGRVRLLLQRDGDRPLVVLDDEDDRHAPDAREVQRLVESPLGGRPVPAVGHDDHVVAAILGGIGEPHRMRELGGHGDRDGQVVLVRRRLAALEPPGEEAEQLLDGPAPPEHGRRLAGGRGHPVRGA